MLNFIFLSLLTFAQDYDSTIIGGQFVTPGETAGQVTVAVGTGGGRVLCSGVIISESAVLTAGHCADGRKLIFSTEVSSKAPMRNVKSVIRAPGFYVGNPSSLAPSAVLPAIRNDLAVMRFEGGLPGGYKVAKLPSSGAEPKEGKTMNVIGYGLNESGSVDGRLRKLAATIDHGDRFSPGMLDQYKKFDVLTTPTKAPCSGDSGGPVLSGSTVYGITSHRMGEAPTYACECQALVFTNVGDYVPWIKGQL